jgi:hypothetical protein
MRLALFCLVAFSACAAPPAAVRDVSGDVARLSDAVYPPFPGDAQVRVSTGDLEEAYEELGVIVVRPGQNLSATEDVAVMHERFREEARRIGAHAIVRIEYYNLGESNTHATGTAVRLVGSR